MNAQSRRRFLETAARGGVGLALLPSIVPSRIFAADAPSKRIQVAQIGCGRMGRSDMTGVMSWPMARLVAVCDLDSVRLNAGRKLAEDFYKERGEANVAIQTFSDYRELLARPDIDAIVISTPDHWHAQIAIEAALAGKHLYVQKPLTYTIAEAIALRKAVRAKKVVLQTGSQQRSEKPWDSFRTVSELVRNGRIGDVKRIKIGLGLDKPSGQKPAAMPVPGNLNFDRWLGPAPQQDYMELRVHSQKSFDARPGWITTENFGLGMITNWGAHHMDIAHWALGQELGGPKTIEARAQFMTDDAWTVHQTYHVEMLYPNDTQIMLDNAFEVGLMFEGTEGWIFCTRGGERVTASDPTLPATLPVRVSDPKLLSPLGKDAIRWMPSKNHYLNWLEAIAAHRDPIAPVDQAARSVEACCAAWIAMKLKRKLSWDAAREEFTGDDEANAMRSRKPRNEMFDFQVAMKKAGLA